MISFSRTLLTLLLLFGVVCDSISEGDSSSLRYRVVDVDDPNKEMESKIVAINLADEAVPITATDEDGYFDSEDIRCQRGEQVKFIPKNELYYPYQTRCPFKGTVVKVGRIQYVHNLAASLRVATLNRNYATAAFLSNEVAMRASAFDPQIAAKLNSGTYQYVGYALGVQTDYQQGWRMSPEFVTAVRKFQIQKGLDSSGELDYPTLRALAGKDINVFIYSSTGESPLTRPRSVKELKEQIESLACDPKC